MPDSPDNVVRKAKRHLKDCGDPVMADIVARIGTVTYRPKKQRFRLLANSIISQQISTKAARSIEKKFSALFSGVVTAQKILNLSDEQLRSAGISPQKLGYMRDLATKVNDGTVSLRRVGQMDNQAVIDEVTKIKGIGVWTAQMFLMFGLGRTDVMPYGDLGIQNAIRAAYRLRKQPDQKKCLKLAQPWSPYATIGCIYLWRSLDD